MVFHCRCFSFEYETKSRAKSCSTETFYTASSDFKRSKYDHPTSSSLALKGTNLRVFTFDELKAATSNFSISSKIGEGGFWSVHKGTVKSLECPFDEIQVAVKLANGQLLGHIKRLREASLLGVVEHPNIVKLVGYCVEDDETEIHPILVYEYMRNGSVEDCLSTTSATHLSWTTRLKVAQDVARGLAHLHDGTDYQVIFRDFKSSSILLDDQWNAKLSFRWLSLHPHPHISSLVTTGYSAPEYNQTYIKTGHLTAACNVWSYGCFLYELITGKLPLDSNLPNNDLQIVRKVKSYLQFKRTRVNVDPRLEDDYSDKSVQKLWVIANRCLSKNPKSRPKMSEVLKMIEKLIGVPSQGA